MDHVIESLKVGLTGLTGHSDTYRPPTNLDPFKPSEGLDHKWRNTYNYYYIITNFPKLEILSGRTPAFKKPQMYIGPFLSLTEFLDLKTLIFDGCHEGSVATIKISRKWPE